MYTNEEKRALVKHIKDKLRETGAIFSPLSLVEPVLFYFIDHQSEIDIEEIISDRKKEEILKQEAIIDEARSKLDTLK